MTPPTGPIDPDKSVEPTGATPKSPGTSFQSHMETPSQIPTQTPTQGPTGVTPMSLASQGPSIPSGTPSIATILNQSKGAQDSLGTVGQQLQTPGLKLKRSQAHLLKNRLNNAHTYLNQASTKLGLEPRPMPTSQGPNPLGKFMAYINDGQNQLVQVQNQLNKMASKGQQLSPGDMLNVTVKMNLAQQEIEYSSTLLAKVIDSFKQIMNTQL